jgi:hypothetical protein
MDNVRGNVNQVTWTDRSRVALDLNYGFTFEDVVKLVRVMRMGFCPRTPLNRPLFDCFEVRSTG